jgi:hypothetical protein
MLVQTSVGIEPSFEPSLNLLSALKPSALRIVK